MCECVHTICLHVCLFCDSFFFLFDQVKTFDDTIESVKDLADGVIFNKIMQEV